MEINKDLYTPQQKKKPNLLIVLLVLSGIYIATNTFGTVQAFMNGPLSQEQVDKQLSTLYGFIDDSKAEGASEGIIRSFKIIASNTEYINNEAFYLYNTLTLISLIFGAVSIFFIYKLKKIGFHLYIIYCLLPVLSMYIVFPTGMVSTYSIVFLLITGTIFSLLYGKNLKYLK